MCYALSIMLKNRRCARFQTGLSLICLLFISTLQAKDFQKLNLDSISVSQALEKVATVYGYSLIYPANKELSITINKLQGSYLLQHAIDKILLNTDYSALITDKKVIIVSLSPKEQDAEYVNKHSLTNSTFTSVKSPHSDRVKPKQKNQSAFNKTERIQIIGTRRIYRSATDSIAPLDVIDHYNLHSRGNHNIISTIANVIPSYNVNQEAISDAGTLVRPANLRGLPTDSTLVLVNGKRRHRSGVIYEYISGLNIGAHGVDLDPIPIIALNSVEVLRDGAAAQYGSDAIAGVINFRFAKDPDLNRIELRSGEYYQGDGANLELSGIFGSTLKNRGIANLAFELSKSKATSRGIQDPAVNQLISNGIDSGDIQDPVVAWGAPNIDHNIKLVGNVEFDLDQDRQFYLFGNWAQREVDGSFFYRNPNTRAGIYTNPDTGRRLFYDMTENNTGKCPTPTLPGSESDNEALQLISTNPNCFAFNEWFPGGFTPRFGGKVKDKSLSLGFKGTTAFNKAESFYDISLTAGNNQVEYKLNNSVNASLGENSPTAFELGSQIQTEFLFNADFVHLWDVGLPTEVNIAYGYQHHFEQFEITAGDKSSHAVGPFAKNGESIGSNGFPGFSPQTAKLNQRKSNAFYIDLETEFTEAILASLAMRYEDIGKIGHNFDSKLSARLQLTDAHALRSTLSTGFRAPSVGQSTLERISTSNKFIDGVVVQQTSQLVSALSPIAINRSGQKLKPEKAINFSLGLVTKIAQTNITLDYFYIDINDRLSLFSSEILPTDAPLLSISGVKDNVDFIQYYANDFNSITQGLDLVASLSFDYLEGKNDLSLAFNYTNTELNVTNRSSPVNDYYIKRERERGIPGTRGVFTYAYSKHKFNAIARINYLGHFYNAQFNVPSLLEKVNPVIITDLELSYEVTDNFFVALGANNLFDVYPSEFSEGRTAGFQGAIYPLNSPSGFNGGHYYLRLGWDM